MASGLPVVACNTAPIPEILGGAGLIVERTAESFEKAFKKLLNNIDLVNCLSVKAKKRAISIDGAIMEKKEVDLYKSLLL